MESFFGTLKNEFFYDHKLKLIDEFKKIYKVGGEISMLQDYATAMQFLKT